MIDPSEPTIGKTAKSFDAKTKNKVTVDSVQFEVNDDNTGIGTGQGFFDIALRGSAGKSPASSGVLTIFGRSGPLVFQPGSSIPIVLKNGTSVATQ